MVDTYNIIQNIISTKMEREGRSSTLLNSSNNNSDIENNKVPAIKGGSKHFTSLQIFTSYAEPALDEYITQQDQTALENKHREEEDKLYRYQIVKADNRKILEKLYNIRLYTSKRKLLKHF